MQSVITAATRSAINEITGKKQQIKQKQKFHGLKAPSNNFKIFSDKPLTTQFNFFF